MFTRPAEFYNLVAHGLSSIGYSGATAFNDYVNDNFATKYNIKSFGANLGFSVNPNIPLAPTFEQLDCTVRPYTMAAYVDIDSEGPTKSTDGFQLKLGNLPTFKHEVTLSRKVLREKMILAEERGGQSQADLNTVLDLLFTRVDSLIGGNYNTIAHQRHQLVSNDCKLVVNGDNYPGSIPLEIDFGLAADHKKESVWYSKSDETVSQASDVTSGKISPLKVMKDIMYMAKTKYFMPRGHWEVSERTWNDLKELPYFKEMFVLAKRPDITDAATRAAFGNLVEDDAVKTFIEQQIGAKIVVIDHVAYTEKYDKEGKKIAYTEQDSFKEGVMVYVPDGELGDIQFGRPVAMVTPGARIAMYDGGRTMLRQVFEDKTMTQYIESEVTGLVVPNKTRWMFRLKIK